MRQTRQQESFAFEGLSSIEQFLCAEPTLAHLFDGYQAVAKLGVRRFVDSAKTAFPNLADNTVALLERMMLKQQTGE